MKNYSFTVFGEPTGKGRPRASSFGGHAKLYTPAKTLSYEAKVKQSFIDQCCNGQMPERPTMNAVTFIIDLYYGLSKADYNSKGLLNKHGNAKIEGFDPCLKKPDVDNCIKAVFDGLNGLLFHDDKQVVQLIVNKRWSETPRVYVSVSIEE